MSRWGELARLDDRQPAVTRGVRADPHQLELLRSPYITELRLNGRPAFRTRIPPVARLHGGKLVASRTSLQRLKNIDKQLCQETAPRRQHPCAGRYSSSAAKSVSESAVCRSISAWSRALLASSRDNLARLRSIPLYDRSRRSSDRSKIGRWC